VDVRRQHNSLSCADRIADPLHLRVEAAHAVLAALYLGGIGVIFELGIAHFADEALADHVEEAVGLDRVILALAFRAYPASALSLLQKIYQNYLRREPASRHTFWMASLIFLCISERRHLTTLQNCWRSIQK